VSDTSIFDTVEAEVERGEPWKYREPGAPNPLTVQVAGWSTGRMKSGDEVEFMTGRDRDGRLWSLLVGAITLKDALIDGNVKRWDDDSGEYVIVQQNGRVQPGEVVSIKYLGDATSKRSGQTYPTFRIARGGQNGATPAVPSPEDQERIWSQLGPDDAFPEGF
jgi:hypothetical protein